MQRGLDQEPTHNGVDDAARDVTPSSAYHHPVLMCRWDFVYCEFFMKVGLVALDNLRQPHAHHCQPDESDQSLTERHGEEARGPVLRTAISIAVRVTCNQLEGGKCKHAIGN